MFKRDRVKALKELEECDTFGNQIKKAMDLHGYGVLRIQEELGNQKIYASEKDIRAWLKDRKYPDITIIYKLCEMLDMNPNELIKAKQLMQEAGLASIDMVTISVVCKFLDKSFVFAFYLGRTMFWFILFSLIPYTWSWANMPILSFLGRLIVAIIFTIAMG